MSLAWARNVRVMLPVATTAFVGCMPKKYVYMSIVEVVVMLASDKVIEVAPVTRVPVTSVYDGVDANSLIAPIMLSDVVVSSV